MIIRLALVILFLTGVIFAAPTQARAAGKPVAQPFARPVHKPIVILAGKTQNDWINIESALRMMKFEIINNPDLSQPITLSDKSHTS